MIEKLKEVTNTALVCNEIHRNSMKKKFCCHCPKFSIARVAAHLPTQSRLAATAGMMWWHLQPTGKRPCLCCCKYSVIDFALKRWVKTFNCLPSSGIAFGTYCQMISSSLNLDSKLNSDQLGLKLEFWQPDQRVVKVLIAPNCQINSVVFYRKMSNLLIR